jgi:hypothetical protein
MPAKLLVLLALGAASTPTVVMVDVAAARRATSAPPAAEAAARIARHATRASTDAVVNELRDVLAAQTLDAVATEWLLDSGLHALRQLPVTPAARALAAELATRAPRVYARVEPEHRRGAAPLYDAGATARYVMREWARGEARVAAAQALDVGSTRTLDTWLAMDGSPRAAAVRDGLVDAWRAAGTSQLAGQRTAIVAAMRAGRDADRLALELAKRLRDPELYALVVEYSEPRIALAAVHGAARELDPAAALDVLGAAADREPVASAALLAIGKLAGDDGAARQLLFARLSDPVSGESAAAALARIDDPAVPAELGSRLGATSDEPTRRRVALALKLNDSASARAALGHLLDSKQGSPQLRKEVAAWLARGR